MVKKSLIYGLVVLIAVVVAVAVGLGYWLLRTESGARWALEAANRWSPATIAFDELNGNLWGRLELTDLKVQSEQGGAFSERLLLHWQPAGLMDRKLIVSELALGDTEVWWNPPESDEEKKAATEPFRFSWPDVPKDLLPVSVRIEQFTVSRLELGAREEPPIELNDIGADLSWDDGRLTVQNARVTGPMGELMGNLTGSLTEPRLAADVVLSGFDPVAEIEKIHVETDLNEADEAILSGPLSLKAFKKEQKPVHLQAKIVVAADHLQLNALEIEREKAPDRVTGELNLDWGQEDMQAGVDLELANVNLGPEVGWQTDLSGTIQGTSDFSSYQGWIDLRNEQQGWEKLSLAAEYSGTPSGLNLTDIEAGYLEGDVSGSAALDWSNGFFSQIDLQGRDLNPGVIPQAPTGSLDLDVKADIAVPPDAPWGVTVDATIHESTLQDYPVAGNLAGSWQNETLIVEELNLEGTGYQLSAAGVLNQKLDFTAEIDRLSALWPEGEGQVFAEGWVRYGESGWGGEISASGADFDWQELAVDRWRLQAQRPQPNEEAMLDAHVEGLIYQQIALSSLDLKAEGMVEDHRVVLQADWGTGSQRSILSGGWQAPQWRGSLESLVVREDRLGQWTAQTSPNLIFGPDRLKVSDLVLAGSQGGDLRIDSNLELDPLAGALEASWRELSLGYLNPWVDQAQFAAKSEGDVAVDILSPSRIDVFADVSIDGAVEFDEYRVELAQARAEVAWDAEGLEAEGLVADEEGGRLEWTIASTEAGRPALPDRGTLQARWDGLMLQRLQRILNLAGDLSGEWTGRLAGSWQPGPVFDIEGRTSISKGKMVWREEEGEVSVALRDAYLDWNWREQGLTGDLNLQLQDYGGVKGAFQLPLPARLPTSMVADAPVSATLDVRLREQGLLEAFLPGLVDETQGTIKADLKMNGTWQDPRLSGQFSLSGAGATLPAAGVTLRDFTLEGELLQEQIRITSLQVKSGPGVLRANGTIQLDQWRFQELQGEVDGEEFRLVYLPEVQILVSPDLNIDSRPNYLSVTGEVRLPEFLIYGRQEEVPVTPSDDVVFVDETRREEAPPFNLDLNVTLILGDNVLVKLKGLDARLDGRLTLATNQHDDIIGRGEIRVTRGRYSAYGITLPIERGRVAFAGGPIEDPNLDILAQRQIGEVEAGVQVTGTPRNPRVELVSDPNMPDTDILSYLVLGRPLGTGTGQTDALMLAAGALLSKGESVALQERLRSRLGIDVLEIDAGGGDVEGSMVTVGKYLTPDLYISFGQSLFAETNVARLRYSLGENWDFESQVGTVSGADLYYKIEFD